MSLFLWFDLLEDEIDEQHKTEIILTLRKRRSLRMTSIFFDMDENMFKKNFRLTKIVFIKLLDDIEPSLRILQRNSSIPNIIKLACLIRFCAQESYLLSVGNDYSLGLAQSTVSLILTEMINVFEEHICPKWIKFSYSNEEEVEAKLFFHEKSGIPGIIGCIDGTHVKIRAPKHDTHHLYYNRKGDFSINIMIVCNHKKVIKFINAKFAGACHDSMVWNMSGLKPFLDQKHRNGVRNTLLLGDAGYPLTGYLITPFRNTTPNSVEARFNKQHSKARVTVEQTIGLLKNRFRCLLGARELHYKPKKATKIVNVCAALHNITIHYGIDFDESIETGEVEKLIISF